MGTGSFMISMLICYVVHHYCRVNDLPLNRNSSIKNMETRHTHMYTSMCAQSAHLTLYRNICVETSGAVAIGPELCFQSVAHIFLYIAYTCIEIHV